MVSASEQKKVRSVCQEFGLGQRKFCQGFINLPLCYTQECLFKHFAVVYACYRAVNNSFPVVTTKYLNPYREITAACSEFHIMNTLFRQNVEFVNVKPGGTYNNHWALKGK